MRQDEWPAYIRRLLYPVLFETDPVNGIDRVLAHVVYAGRPGFGSQDYLAAIQAALASTQPLSGLLPQDHSEAVIRQFLLDLQDRLES